MRCFTIKVPKPGHQPLKDPRCILDYGHSGAHQYNPDEFESLPDMPDPPE
jgi:hypothetical protein